MMPSNITLDKTKSTTTAGTSPIYDAAHRAYLFKFLILTALKYFKNLSNNNFCLYKMTKMIIFIKYLNFCKDIFF